MARALLGDPPLLILDDPFSHLDEETEAEILEEILRVRPDATVLFTTHRISSLRRAQRIVVLMDGRVVQDGTPEQLRNTPGYFQRLCRQEELAWQAEDLIRGETR